MRPYSVMWPQLYNKWKLIQFSHFMHNELYYNIFFFWKKNLVYQQGVFIISAIICMISYCHPQCTASHLHVYSFFIRICSIKILHWTRNATSILHFYWYDFVLGVLGNHEIVFCIHWWWLYRRFDNDSSNHIIKAKKCANAREQKWIQNTMLNKPQKITRQVWRWALFIRTHAYGYDRWYSYIHILLLYVNMCRPEQLSKRFNVDKWVLRTRFNERLIIINNRLCSLRTCFN